MQAILSDIENDKERSFEKTNDGYVITAKANYSNNDNLVKQKIYTDNKANITKVEVLDNNDDIKIKMSFNTIDLNSTYDENYFKLETSMKSANITNEEEPVSKIDEVIFPMYLPENTKLTAQDKVYVDSGERVILTFSGDKSFVLVQEVAKTGNDVTIPVNGEPEMILDTIGSISETSANWSSNGVEYYISSSNMSQKELLSVANSMSIMPVGK